MSGSKGGGGGGKGGSVTPVGGGYGGGNQYGTGYYNPQPRLPATPYNSMMDVYGSSQNVMQPMSGYYNQYPAGGSNYQPYQPQPVYEPTPMPDPPPAPNPGTGPSNGQGGYSGNPTQPNMDFNNYNINDIGNLITRSIFGDYTGIPTAGNYQQTYQQPAQEAQQPVYNNFQAPVYENQSVYAQPMDQGSNSFAADPVFYQNNNAQYAAPATATGNYNMTTNTQQLSEAPQLAAPAQGSYQQPRPDGYPMSQPTQQVQMPILDAASNPGFGGYDQNARATMYAPPMFNFGGYY